MISWNVGNCSENSLGRLKCCKHWEQLYGQLLDSFGGFMRISQNLRKSLLIRCLHLVFSQRLMHDGTLNIKGMIKHQALGWGNSQK
jgi:hypothetical protein